MPLQICIKPPDVGVQQNLRDTIIAQDTEKRMARAIHGALLERSSVLAQYDIRPVFTVNLL